MLHAATQDLACLREVGLDPHTIFDTELAARLLGMPRVGLGTVVEELLGIHLAKEHSAADWSTRPLPEPWLDYAALDVELLPDLRDAIAALLEEAGKTEIAAAGVRRRTRRATSSRCAQSRGAACRASTRMRGIRNLAVARELWLSRDELAREIDIAPGRLVPDASLTAAAQGDAGDQARPRRPARVQRPRQPHRDSTAGGRRSRPGRTTTDLPVMRGNGDSLPPPRAWADRNPEADARLKAARAADRRAVGGASRSRSRTSSLPRRCAGSRGLRLPRSTAGVDRRRAGRMGCADPGRLRQPHRSIAQAFVEASQNAPTTLPKPIRRNKQTILAAPQGRP